jgi:hypothetical protein
MNRHDRRAARKQAAKASEAYLRTHRPFLEKAAAGQPMRSGVHHVVYRHDDWCGHFKGDECNCNPTIERFVEPKNA